METVGKLNTVPLALSSVPCVLHFQVLTSECNFPVLCYPCITVRCNGTQGTSHFYFFVLIQLLAAGAESDELAGRSDARCLASLLVAVADYRTIVRHANVGTPNVANSELIVTCEHGKCYCFCWGA